MSEILTKTTSPFEFVLTEEEDHVCIVVRSLSVHIKREGDGVSVEMRREDQTEDEESLTESWATFAEGTSG